MSYWIYNMGLAVPVSSQRLLSKHKVLPLEQLAKNQDIRSSDKEKPPESLAKSGYPNNEHHSRKKVYRADQIMSSPVTTIDPKMPFNQLWSLFAQKRYRHFLVTGEDNRLLGIVSDRDLLSKVANQALNGQPQATEDTVAQIMQATVLCASPTSNIQELCQVMFSQHIGALAITTDDGQVLGIVTRSDILRSMIMHGPLELYV